MTRGSDEKRTKFIEAGTRFTSRGPTLLCMVLAMRQLAHQHNLSRVQRSVLAGGQRDPEERSSRKVGGRANTV